MAFISLKHGEVFSVTNECGDMDSHTPGAGVYRRDTRFFKNYVMLLDGSELLYLTHKHNGPVSEFLLSNNSPSIRPSNAEKMDLEVRRSQFVYSNTLFDRVEIHNGSQKNLTLTVEFKLETEFEDIFEVRGWSDEDWSQQKGTNRTVTETTDCGTTISYSGLDNIRRVLHWTFPAGADIRSNHITYVIELSPNQSQLLDFQFVALVEDENGSKSITYEDGYASLQREFSEWRASNTRIQTDNLSVNHTLEQSELDLFKLSTDVGFGSFLAAGIPWFGVLFGRDSIIAALQSMIYSPQLALGTLRTLAHYQGTVKSDWNEEYPGRILHEMRFGELSNLSKIPFARYYGSIDSTPLFLILLSEFFRWTHNLDAVQELLPAAERALSYLSEYADLDGDGLIEFHKESNGGLNVQSWKDSNFSMVHKDGTHSHSPMAAIEAQGYVYDAKVRLAEIYTELGDMERAKKLLDEALALRVRFNQAFWLEEDQYFALALDKDKKPIATITSNPGHALWSGIVDMDKSESVADRLLSDELFSGWGIRTMSKEEQVFSPVSYHNGSVWPHDNSLIALGLSKYKFDKHLASLTQTLFEAAEQFPDHRLPELFCGYDRSSGMVPYPVACSPQAWAAGTPFASILALLGIQLNPAEKTISINPVLPPNFNELIVENLSLGDGRINLTVSRGGDGQTELQVKQNTSGYTVK